MTIVDPLDKMTVEGPGQLLPPAALISIGITSLVKFVVNGWQGFVPLLAVAGTNERLRDAANYSLIGIVGLALFVVFTLLAYWRFRYWLEDDRVHVRQGVFNQKQLTLTYERVQSVHTEQPLYFRPFGLVELKLESAGSTGEEVKLPGLAQDRAARLHQIIIDRRADAVGDTKQGQAAETQTSGEGTLLTLAFRALALFGLVDRRLLIAFGAVAAFYGSANDMVDPLVRQLINAVADQMEALGIAGGAVAIAVTVALVLLGAALVSMLVHAVLMYDFRLIGRDQGFAIRYGLLARKEKSLSRRKIQCLIVQQLPLGRLLGLREIRVVQAGGGKASIDSSGFDPGGEKFRIPALSDDQMATVSDALMPTLPPEPDQWQSIAAAYVFPNMLIHLLIAVIFSVIAFFAGQPWLLLAWIWPALMLPWTILERRRYCFALADDHAFVRLGVIGEKRMVFPHFKVQTVSLRQSVLQRRRGVASLTIRLAGKAVRIPYMPISHARMWRDRLIDAAETTDRAWM